MPQDSLMQDTGPNDLTLPASPYANEPLRITIRPDGAKPIAQPIAEPSLPTQGTVTPELASDLAAEETNNVKTNVRDPNVISQAFSSGASEDDIVNYMSSNGVDPEEARSMVANTLKAKVLEAKKQGVSDDEIASYMSANGFNPDVTVKALKSAEPAKSKFDFDPNATVAENAMDLADLYKSIHGKYSTTGKMLGGLVDENMALEARQEINQLNVGVMQTLKQNGIEASINPEDGEVYVTNEDGQQEPLDSSMLNDLWNSKMNMVGTASGASLGTTGGIAAGTAAGAAIGSVVPVIGTAVGAAVGAAVGGTVGFFGGSAVGGSLGTAADLTLNSMRTKERLKEELYKSQMVEAGIADMTMSSMLKVGAVVGKSIGKGTMGAFNYLKKGNESGALQQLIDNLHMSNEQAREWIDNAKRYITQDVVKQSHIANMLSFGKKQVATKTASGPASDIGVLLNTHPMAEAYVKEVASKDHQIANSIAISLDERAKGLNKAIQTIEDVNTSAKVRHDLNSYVKDVKDLYSKVKEIGDYSVSGTDFKYDLNKLAIEPVLKDIEKTIPPKMQERFVGMMTRIELATKDRSFRSLVDLRQAVNDFKYGVKGLTPVHVESLNKVLNSIDGQITKAAKDYIPDSKVWLEQFAKAKKAYAQMKQLQQNELYRTITKATGKTELTIQNMLNKFGNNKDVDLETLNPVLERLSPHTRMLTEGAAIRNMVNRHTLGSATEMQAVDFPMLAEDLKMLNINSPEAKQLVGVIDELAKVFKNDKALSSVTGRIHTGSTNSMAFASTIEGKVKGSILKLVWQATSDAIMARVPSKAGRNQALIKVANEVLQDPLKSVTADKLIKSVPEASQPEMRSLIKELQIAFAKQSTVQGTKPVEWQNMYKQSASGKLVETDGVLGRGLYLVDKVKNPTPGANIVKHEVNLTRMATLDSISKFVGLTVTEKDLPILLKNTALREQLIEQGMQGIKLDGKAMLFPNTTVGVKSQPIKKAVKELTVNKLGRLDSNSLTTEQKAILQFRTGLGYMINDTSGSLKTPSDYSWAIEDINKRITDPSFDINNEEFADMAEVYERFIGKKDVKRVLDSIAIQLPDTIQIARAPNPDAKVGDYVSAWADSSRKTFAGEETKVYTVKKGSKYIPENDFLEPGEILVKLEDLQEVGTK